MSELGNSLQRIRKVENKNNLAFKENKKVPIGIKTPLEQGSAQHENLFKMHTDIFSQVEDNLKNLIMTQKGERLCFLDFGTDLSSIYSNTVEDDGRVLTDDEIVDKASREVFNAVSKYIPGITLVDFYSEKIPDSGVRSNQSLSLGKDMSSQSITLRTDSYLKTNSSNLNENTQYLIKITYIILGKTKTLSLVINTSE